MINHTVNTYIQPISFEAETFNLIKQKLSVLDWSIFLESADQKHVNSRWSIYSADPIATLQCKKGFISIDGLGLDLVNKKSFERDLLINKNPLSVCNQLRQHLFGRESKRSNDDLIPFSGGVLGVLNYELGHYFETIKNYAPPNEIDIADVALGFYDWALLHDNKDDQLLLVVRQHTKSTKELTKYFDERLSWLHSLSICNDENESSDFKMTSKWSSNMSKASYSEKFEQVQRYILSGDCYQVNLAQRFKAGYVGNEYQAYRKLILNNRPPFSGFLRLPTHAILSLSPERFLKLSNNKIETKPIKGTRPRFDDQVLDEKSKFELKESEKDRAENLMIVDLLRNDIGKVSKAGSVKVPSLFEIESFPAIHHLVSTITSELKEEYSTEELITAGFPGGSITGAPKIRAMEIISELEPDSRTVYCGSIGYIDAQGNMDMNISIRTLLCHQGNIYCWAGGGLVADSQVDLEYQECFDKVNRILPILYNDDRD